MNILIRVDASRTIGTGHLMRCLTLADEMKVRGAEVTFISRQIPAYLQQSVEDNGHRVIKMEAESGSRPHEGLAELEHSHFLETSQRQDSLQTKLHLNQEHFDWLIVDHYALDYRWELEMRSITGKILVIDDLADRMHDCDLVLDQNLQISTWQRYSKRVPESSKLLMGPRYAMLRSEFLDCNLELRVRKDKPKRIVVFFGGIDEANFTEPVILAVAALKISDLEVDVIIGAKHPAREEIVKHCKDNSFTCHIQTKRIAFLFSRADASIGAGGSTIWERGCLGLPTLVFIVAENQREASICAEHHNLLKLAESSKDNAKALQQEIGGFLSNRSMLESISRSCLCKLDAKGTGRVAKFMLSIVE